FEQIVNAYYQPLYRFALGLTHHEAEARDITQETFHRWAMKGHQLRDKTKVKTWLFTTLHREFLSAQRRASRFPHVNVQSVAHELPAIPASAALHLDGEIVLAAVAQVDDVYRAPLVLFYLKEL